MAVKTIRNSSVIDGNSIFLMSSKDSWTFNRVIVLSAVSHSKTTKSMWTTITKLVWFEVYSAGVAIISVSLRTVQVISDRSMSICLIRL